MTKPLLRVQGLRTHFFTDKGVVRAVDGVDLEIGERETLGLVGESGCGKSVTALAIMRLVPNPPGKIVSGSILFDGQDLCLLSEPELCHIRGHKIGMVFQEPMTSLNPVFTIGYQITEPMLLHLDISRREARDRALELLRLVGIAAPERCFDSYPHQLSGGMRQRAMIAMALACQPKLLIADEPTTALDVTIQAQIMELLQRLKAEQGLAILLITHDLGVVAEAADRVAIMYAGQVVEEAPVEELYSRPKHPYTVGLLQSVPRIDQGGAGLRLFAIPGSVPDLVSPPPGCRFHPRCFEVQEICRRQPPEYLALSPEHKVRCWLYAEG